MRQTPLKRRPARRRRGAIGRRRNPGYVGETRELAKALRAAWKAEPEPCAVSGLATSAPSCTTIRTRT